MLSVTVVPRILGILPLSAFRGPRATRGFDLLLFTDEGVVLIGLCESPKGFGDMTIAFPESIRWRDLFRELPGSSRSFRESLYSVVGRVLTREELSAICRKVLLGLIGRYCRFVSYGDVESLVIRPLGRSVEVVVETTGWRKYKYYTLPDAYADLSPDEALNEVLRQTSRLSVRVEVRKS